METTNNLNVTTAARAFIESAGTERDRQYPIPANSCL